MTSVTRIPPSLGSNQATSVPFFFQLTFGLTQKWKEQLRSDIGSDGGTVTYILPPPKQGINTSTQTQNANEMQFWQLNYTDAGRVGGVSQIMYAVQNAVTKWAGGNGDEDLLAMSGGKYLQQDLSRIQFKGSKKRGYQFGFELWAYTDQDTEKIRDFNRVMHAATMTQATNGPWPFRVPPLFRFSIVTQASGGPASVDITNNYFVDPQPCTLVAFNSTTLTETPVIDNNNRSGRILVNMTFLEIEPTAWSGNLDPSGKVVQQHNSNLCAFP